MGQDGDDIWQKLGQLKCKVCGFVTSDQGFMQAHNCRRPKVDQPDKPSVKYSYLSNKFTCSLCSFQDLEPSFILHLQQHLLISPFKCDTCSQCFFAYEKLRSHILFAHPSTSGNFSLLVSEKTRYILNNAKTKGVEFFTVLPQANGEIDHSSHVFQLNIDLTATIPQTGMNDEPLQEGSRSLLPVIYPSKDDKKSVDLQHQKNTDQSSSVLPYPIASENFTSSSDSLLPENTSISSQQKIVEPSPVVTHSLSNVSEENVLISSNSLKPYTVPLQEHVDKSLRVAPASSVFSFENIKTSSNSCILAKTSIPHQQPNIETPQLISSSSLPKTCPNPNVKASPQLFQHPTAKYHLPQDIGQPHVTSKPSLRNHCIESGRSNVMLMPQYTRSPMPIQQQRFLPPLAFLTPSQAMIYPTVSCSSTTRSSQLTNTATAYMQRAMNPYPLSTSSHAPTLYPVSPFVPQHLYQYPSSAYQCVYPQPYLNIASIPRTHIPQFVNSSEKENFEFYQARHKTSCFSLNKSQDIPVSSVDSNFGISKGQASNNFHGQSEPMKVTAVSINSTCSQPSIEKIQCDISTTSCPDVVIDVNSNYCTDVQDSCVSVDEKKLGECSSLFHVVNNTMFCYNSKCREIFTNVASFYQHVYKDLHSVFPECCPHGYSGDCSLFRRVIHGLDKKSVGQLKRMELSQIEANVIEPSNVTNDENRSSTFCDFGKTCKEENFASENIESYVKQECIEVSDLNRDASLRESDMGRRHSCEEELPNTAKITKRHHSCDSFEVTMHQNSLSDTDNSYMVTDIDFEAVEDDLVKFSCILNEHMNKDFYKCSFQNCDFSAHQSIHLLIHMESAHGNEEEFYCIYCGFMGDKVTDLVHHVALHNSSESRSYSASVISDSVLQPVSCVHQNLNNIVCNLEKQSGTHEGCNFQCDTCGCRFSSVSKLKTHMETSSLKTYGCKLCSSIFLDSKSFEGHFLDNHPGRSRFNRVIVNFLCKFRAMYFRSFCKILKQYIASSEDKEISPRYSPISEASYSPLCDPISNPTSRATTPVLPSDNVESDNLTQYLAKENHISMSSSATFSVEPLITSVDDNQGTSPNKPISFPGSVKCGEDCTSSLAAETDLHHTCNSENHVEDCISSLATETDLHHTCNSENHVEDCTSSIAAETDLHHSCNSENHFDHSEIPTSTSHLVFPQKPHSLPKKTVVSSDKESIDLVAKDNSSTKSFVTPTSPSVVVSSLISSPIMHENESIAAVAPENIQNNIDIESAKTNTHEERSCLVLKKVVNSSSQNQEFSIISLKGSNVSPLDKSYTQHCDKSHLASTDITIEVESSNCSENPIVPTENSIHVCVSRESSHHLNNHHNPTDSSSACLLKRPPSFENCDSDVRGKRRKEDSNISSDSETISYKCKFCAYECKWDPEKMKDHLRNATNHLFYQCYYCNNPYFAQRTLRNHIKFHHGNEPFKYRELGIELIFYPNLQTKVRQPPQEVKPRKEVQIFVDPGVSPNEKSSERVIVPNEIIRGDLTYPNHPKQINAGRQSLKHNGKKRNVKKFRCKRCKMEFISIYDLCIHHKSAHEGLSVKWVDVKSSNIYSSSGKLLGGNSISDSPIKRYLCNLCDYRSEFRSSVHKHQEMNHDSSRAYVIKLHGFSAYLKNFPPSSKSNSKYKGSARKDKVKTGEKVRKDPLIFNCHKCHSTSASEFFFRIHLAKHDGFKHTTTLSTQDGLLICAHCSYIAHSNIDLANHVTSHVTDRRYKCSLCDRESHHKKDILNHIDKKHKGEVDAKVLDREKRKGKEMKHKAVNLSPIIYLNRLSKHKYSRWL